MIGQRIRIRLQAFDHRMLDQSAREIVGTVQRTGATAIGPVPLPRKRNSFTVNRSTNIDKKSREQFEIRTYKRLIEIRNSTPQTIEALGKLDLAAGVDVKIQVMGAMAA